MLKKLNLLLIAIPIYLYGITPINIVEIGEKERGLYGSLNLAFNSSRGNSEIERYSVSSSINKFNKRDLWLFNANYTFEQSYSVKTANYSFIHLRNIRKLYNETNSVGCTDWEYFGQIENNEFQKLDFRGLLGAGLRFKPFKEYRFFLGVGPVFVRETYLDKTDSENMVRGNFYVNIKNSITKRTSISYVAYYQPRVDKLNDFDLTQSFELENGITEHFSLVINLSYDYDSHPIDQVEKYDFGQTTSFKYKF